MKELRALLMPFDTEPGPPAEDIPVTRTKHPKHTCENGVEYEGEMDDKNHKDGLGIQIKVDGSLYEGYWKGNKKNGRGRLINADGGIYTGEWLDGQRHGFGMQYHHDGTKFEGYWKEGTQHG